MDDAPQAKYAVVIVVIEDTNDAFQEVSFGAIDIEDLGSNLSYEEARKVAEQAYQAAAR